MSYRNNIEQQNLLNQFLRENGVELPGETLGKLYDYADLVVETKQFGNLISAKDSEKFLSRHIADSLVPYLVMSHELSVVGKNEYKNPLLKTQNSELKWADMGAGAGCPVFPLAIVMPQVQFYAVEPRNMRVQFMQMAKEKLGLKNLTVVGKRFETSGLTDLDFISCRALSTFENDWERARPALKKGGMFLTLKSYNNVAQLESDPAIILHKYTLPNEEQVYALVTRGNE
ncbi:16S rRNA (guanine(527)-N(7))-methyltransferase RsmG [Fibrobacter sp.]|uniref:16S rRNA (guanine(527)-N(7))-methyltransferase RsmG n=1 Tax=Fibrobacter sp. TaxID=35828 RepID=UPI00388DEB87